jgi:hypothetical protein
VGVITDADFFPDGLAIDPIADMIDALGMMLWRATHETPVGTETLLRLPDRRTVRLGMGARYSPMKPKPSTLEPKSVEPTVVIPIEQQIQQRAYELYEQRGRTDGHDLEDWLQAECEIRGTQANAAAA